MFNFLSSKFSSKISSKEQIQLLPSGIAEKLEAKARPNECEDQIRTFIAMNPESLQKTIAEADASNFTGYLMKLPTYCTDSWGGSYNMKLFIGKELQIRSGSHIDVWMNGEVEYRPYSYIYRGDP